jgi:hypothetical protein
VGIGASADISEVSGATAWDKVQAVLFNGATGSAVCSPGGGCTGTHTSSVEDVNISCSCFCLREDHTVTTIGNHPVDQQCLYASGTVNFSLS